MRNRDYVLVHSVDGATISEGEGDATANRVFTCLSIRKGSYIADEKFGSQLHLIQKKTEKSIAQAGVYALAAMQHLINDGTFRSVSLRQSVAENGGIGVYLTAIKNNGEQADYSHFIAL